MSNKPVFCITTSIVIPTYLAAAGYSLMYMIGGGGLGVAILIFIIAKMLGK